MHIRRFTPSIVVALLVLALLMPLYLSVTAHRVQANSSTYYIDYNNGNDSCNGQYEAAASAMPNCAWKTFQNVHTTCFGPGDNILLEDNDTWSEPNPQSNQSFFYTPSGCSGSGTPIDGGSITVSNYCNQNLYINCQNNPPPPEIDAKGDEAAIYLHNQSYWVISNVTVTNTPSGCTGIEQDPLPSDCANSSTPRQGIYVYVNNPGPNPAVYQHIYVSHVTVKDVDGLNQGITDPNSDSVKTTGGIVYYIDGHGSAGTFNDIQVTNTTVHDVYYEGIILTSDFLGPPVQNQSCFSTWTNFQPSTNEQVENNYVYSVGGNGISVHVSSGSLISQNIVRNGGKAESDSEGIASLDNYQAVIEQNQVYNMKFNGADQYGYPDSVPFDVDDCDNGTKVEYNYSHDNEGGFMTIEPYAINAVVRYNISERDGYGDSDYFNLPHPTYGVGAILKVAQKSQLGDAGQNWKVYNNDFFMDDQHGDGPGAQLLNDPLPSGLNSAPLFENNLIETLQTSSSDTYASCSGPIFAGQLPYTGTPWTLDYNGFYSSHSGGCPNTPSQSHAITGNPDFDLAAPGGGYDGDSGDANDDWQQDAAAAYTLSSNSPAICTGIPLEPSGDDFVDFIDHPIPKTTTSVDAGALDYSTTCQ